MHCCGYYTIILIGLMEKFVNASQWYIIRAEVHDIVFSCIYTNNANVDLALYSVPLLKLWATQQVFRKKM